MAFEFPPEGKTVKTKIILVCTLCIFKFSFNAAGLGGGYLIVSPNYGPEVAAENAAWLAAARDEEQQKLIRQAFVPHDPWRVFYGITNYVKLRGVEFSGKVMDITSGGVRIQGEFGTLFGTDYSPDSEQNYDDFFIAHYPYDVVNGQVIPSSYHLMAWYVGTYTYTTVNGGSRTIRKLDYGIPSDPAPEFIQQQIDAAKAKAILDKQKYEQGQINAVRWLQSQATNGVAYAQCSLGEHYLNGQGCETNRDQAIYWLQKSASQGYIEASNKLATLQNQK